MQQYLLEGLNPEQRRAVETTEGPLLIQAGAGSGKTKTLTHRIAYIIANGLAAPYNILAVTFTNKAAKEMRARVAQLLGENADNRGFMPYMGTFHGICVRLLRMDGEHIGIPRSYVIFDESDAQAAIKQASKLLGIDEKSFPARLIKSLISGAKNELLTPEEFAGTANSPAMEAAAKVYPLYQQALKEAAALDFDDLINRTVYLFESRPEIREKWQNQFRYILIDEYQDTNAAQYRLVRLLTNKRRNIAVVGDDWQCLLPGTQVRTAVGTKNIEDMESGTLISAATGYAKTGHFPVGARREFYFSGTVMHITTVSGIELTCTPNHIMFGRWEPTDAYVVYLMFARDMGYRIGMAKGTRFDGKKDAAGLQVRANQERADRMWVLRVCAARTEAMFAEALLSYKYGIPTTVFRAYSNRSMRMDQAHITELYRPLDTGVRAQQLMKDEGLLFDYPHFLPQATVRNGLKRVVVNAVLFGDKRTSIQSPWSASRISINTTHREDMAVFAGLGYTVRSGRAGTYRSESYSLDYGTIEERVEVVRSADNDGSLQIGRYAFLTEEKFTFLPASQLHAGMSVAVYREGEIVRDTIHSVYKEHYEGPVYDLDVDKVHNYIANGLVVHNSIYSWRGADFRNILNFEKDYKDCTVIKLEQNYRSTKHILDAAHAIITKNLQRSDKQLWTDAGDGLPIQILQAAGEQAEAELIIRRVRYAIDAGLRHFRDFAVLYRTNAQSRAIEEAFVRYGIPYRIVGGVRFYDRKEIKDILAYLRLIFQSEDRVSFERVVNIPARGIGAKSLQNFYNWQRSHSLSLAAALQAADECKEITAKARKGLSELGEMLSTLRTVMQDTTVAALIDSLLRRINYLNYLDDGTPQGEARQENVKELLSVAQEYQEVGLEGFLEEVALISDIDSADLGGDAVVLMTLHAAKGLEFPVVFMIGMEESIFPHTRALYDANEMEEERRLCYVGMTRARQELYMTYATSRMLYGGVQHNIPSRFLSEIDAGFQMQTGGMVYEPSRRYDAEPSWAPTSSFGSSASTTCTASNEPRYVPEVNEGDGVRHPVFGAGTIMEKDGDMVTVYFKGKGAKRLNLSFAPLEKL